MRTLRSKYPQISADIVVSELLGSWGDNEASPECLHSLEETSSDGKEALLRPGGVMIPQSYCSYAAPVSCNRLWMQARDMQLNPQGPHHEVYAMDGAHRTGLDTPYVVNMHHYYLLAEAKPLFTFDHPASPSSNSSGSDGEEDTTLMGGKYSRYALSEFTMQSDDAVVLHGFAGYFTCILYKDITLSTVPSSHSPGMFSWFPMYLPITTPILVKRGESITLLLWRISTPTRVWYEWCLSKPTVTSVQNANGVSFSVRL